MIEIDQGIEEILNKIKNGAKKAVKKLIIISLPIIFIFLLLAGMVYVIIDDNGTWENDEAGNPGSYTNNTSVSTTGGISVDKYALIKQGLKDKGYSETKIDSMTEQEIIEILEMSRKLERTITSINDCTEAEILWCLSNLYKNYLKTPAELEYLLRAELVTQYPKINNLSADKLNGIIQFKRITSGNEVMLSYLEPDQFEVKYLDYQNNGKEDVFNYFTLDTEGNAVIATWIEETGNFSSNNTTSSGNERINAGHTEQTIKDTYDSRYTVTKDKKDIIQASYSSYTVDKKPINYKTMIQQYTLPFEYLWSLLVVGRSYEFVEGLASLAYDSEIIIGIYDSVTTTVNISKKEYTENFREKYEKYESRDQSTEGTLVDNTDWSEKNFSYYDENNITIKSNYPVIDLIYANTWIAEVTTQYQNIQSNDEPYESENNPSDENWEDNGSTTASSIDYIEEIDYTSYKVILGIKVYDKKKVPIYITEKDYKEKRMTNQFNKTSTTKQHNLYEKVNSIVNEKTDTAESTGNNFVKLLLENKNAYDLLTNKGTIPWLKGILEKNQSTSNMVDLTLYLLNKATNTTDYLGEGITFDDIWAAFELSSSSIKLVGRDFIVNTQKSGPELVIEDRNALIEMINAKYSGTARENLLAQVDTFLEMQKTYNVNAVFAIAVTQIESSCGTDFTGAIAESTHNWMSMTGSYNGKTYKNPNSTNPRTWRVYDNFGEATMDFGNVIKNGSYYFKAGKNTVREIAPTYCSESWGESVITIMTGLFAEAGINVSGGNGTYGYESGDSYSSTYSVGGRTYRNYKQPKNSDWCGITSAAIVLSGYGYSDTPSMVYNGSIPDYTWRSYMGTKFGTGALEYQKSNIEDGVIKQLNKGIPVIVHVPKDNPGKYTTKEGHFFVILSLDGETCVVSDPGVADNDAKGRNGENNIYEVLEYVDMFVVM